jgi:hypothetical protein
MAIASFQAKLAECCIYRGIRRAMAPERRPVLL